MQQEIKFFSRDYFEALKDIVLQYVLNNYDYCYLDAMHEKNRTMGTGTVIAGSSHAMNGILENKMTEGAINFSISSQDVYFDYLNIRKALEEGKTRIERCIISIGYYMLYQDLSLSRYLSYMMPRIYDPLFGDVHHYTENCTYDMWEKVQYDRNTYSKELVQTLCQEWARGFFIEQSSYYGSLRTREGNNILGLKNVVWSKLSEAEKDELARKRAQDHNRLKKHEHSRRENGVLIQEMTEYLTGKGITPVFVIFPYTGWYNRYIDAGYREDIYRLLDGLSVPVEFWDMNDYAGLFDDSDFLDTDHLNDKGAEKATALLEELLKLTE